MVKNNPLHKTIGELLGGKIRGCKVVKDVDCGGKHTLRLYLSEDAPHKENKCYDVDLLLFKDNKVKVIIEKIVGYLTIHKQVNPF